MSDIPRMTKNEMVIQLSLVKKQATKIGHAYLQTQFPIKLGKELNTMLKPFCKIENSCTKAIEMIEDELKTN